MSADLRELLVMIGYALAVTAGLILGLPLVIAALAALTPDFHH